MFLILMIILAFVNGYFMLFGKAPFISAVGLIICLASIGMHVNTWLGKLRRMAESRREFEVRMTPEVQNQLAQLPEEVRTAALAAMEEAKRNPFLGDPMSRSPLAKLETQLLRYYRRRYLKRLDAEKVEMPPPVEIKFESPSFPPPAGEEEKAS